jgi:MDMPI C-terminal domain
VHRRDAQDAIGVADRLSHANDFLSETFGNLVPGLIAQFAAPVPTGTIQLRSTDQPLAWRSPQRAGGRSLDSKHTHADVIVTGTTSDLFLTLWNRPNISTTVGDSDVLKQWQRAITGS